MNENIKVLFLSSEVMPFAKTGGLADVAGSLPVALKHAGIDVRLVLPFYRIIRESPFKNRMLISDLEVPFGERTLKADVFETSISEDIPVYLVKREDLFDRPGLYGNSKGDYYDNLERFSFFSHASLRTAQAAGFSPDIIHCHDWQTGLVPALLKGPYRTSTGLSGAATVFTIHNMGYQGLFAPDKLAVTGLSGPQYFHSEGLEYWGNISLLKAGIVYADAVTTVSPTYAEEILNHEYGLGMEGVILSRRVSLYGILNGVDYDEWNPLKDIHISARYTRKAISLKKRCKRELIREVGLSPDLEEKPLIGMISRLDNQKGLDILIPVLDEIIGLDTGMVILGSGDEGMENALMKSAGMHPGRIAIHAGFNNPLAHRIMAGADIFLIPSRYEPCGLTQMYALKYGTVPVVRATGGLNDTIEQYDKRRSTGNGFKFVPYSSEALVTAVKQAVELFKDKYTWRRLMKSG
ncbi:MAG: glycogen synthase GlgA, partial [Deltaproteobacteria bacterium]|nr:glycogen synthase GlgA [Deltaproteobacteria bacterium]